MPTTWNEIAHATLDNNTNSQPIQADATAVAKYGAPSVAVVTAVLTGILGAAWKLDPSRPAVLFSAAIIVAAIALGIYLAFATDIRTRGAVTIARYEAIAKLAAYSNEPGLRGTANLSRESVAALKQLAANNAQAARDDA